MPETSAAWVRHAGRVIARGAPVETRTTRGDMMDGPSLGGNSIGSPGTGTGTSAMHTVRIHDVRDNLLEFDLRHILAALGSRARAWCWMVSGVAAYDEPLDVTGEQAERLEELAASGRRIAGDRLGDLANGIRQVIWGEFHAYEDPGATVPVLIVRAIDSSFYEVATDDRRVLHRLEATFRDVRQT